MGAYNINSSSGCFRLGSFRPGAGFSIRTHWVHPGAVCLAPIPPAQNHSPLQRWKHPFACHLPSEGFRPPNLYSQTRPVPAHDSSSPSEPLLDPPVHSPFSHLSSGRFPTPLFVANYPPHPSHRPDVLRIHRTFSYSSSFSPLPSTPYSSAEGYTVR